MPKQKYDPELELLCDSLIQIMDRAAIEGDRGRLERVAKVLDLLRDQLLPVALHRLDAPWGQRQT